MATLTKDQFLLTPGPLTTSSTVKMAMLRDVAPTDGEFVTLLGDVRRRLLELAGVSAEDGFEAVLIPGGGTHAMESVLSSTAPIDGKVLIAINGAHGKRMLDIARRHVVETAVLTFPEDEPVSAERLEAELARDRWIQQVAVVHCETATGLLNPLAELSQVCARHKKSLIVDAVSSFGGIPIDLGTHPADFLVSSAGLCFEGVPGLSFVVCRREALEASAGLARTYSLDLMAQWKSLEDNHQFRGSAPTHALLAFRQALQELENEGGVAIRHKRYRSNHKGLTRGMRELGFQEFVPAAHQSPIATTYLCPPHPRFEYDVFVEGLREEGFVIDRGQVTHEDCFRVGCIGRMGSAEVKEFLKAVRSVLADMDVDPKAVSALDDD